MWTNEIKLSGRAVRDAAKTGGRSPWKFSLCQSGGKRQDGGRSPDQYFDVVSWHDTGGKIKHGAEVLVCGRLRQNRWQADDGTPRERFEIEAKELTFLSEPGKPAGASEAPKPEVPTTAAPLTPKYPIPEHAPRQIKTAPARPITKADPITSEDVGF